MAFLHPPAARAAFRHHVARDGFEVVFVEREDDGYRFDGHTAAVEDGEAWFVHYTVWVDAAFRARRARIEGRSRVGARRRELERDGAGWRVDGAPAPHLDGCLDVDLESSAATNSFPVRRLALAVGDAAEAPAAYVRALGLGVERLEQRYTRLAHDGDGERYAYWSPAFDFACELVYDAGGLVVDYPGIAARVH